MRVRVDVGHRTYLGLCGCGARVLAFTHQEALEQLAAHERLAHEGEQHARDALRQYRERHSDTPLAP
jgi:DNA-binding IclR family transcriptional regulator